MGKWSQRQLAGGGGTSNAVAPAPVLQITGGDTLEWEWFRTNPFQWEFQSSVNGVTEWEGDGEADGVDRSLVPAANHLYWKVFGVDTDGNRATGESNVVHMTNG